MPSGFRTRPFPYLNFAEQLAKGLWPWSTGVRGRLPEHYKKHFMQKHMIEPPAIHYKTDNRKYVSDKHNQPLRVQNVSIPLFYPREADKGLWGGEGFVIGLRKRKDNPMKPKTPRIWKPNLKHRVFYSEVLDKWLSITVTPRTLDLIDEMAGFDNYILKSHEAELMSSLGMSLKREMLKSLATKSLYPNDPERRETIYEKYRQFIIPEEEIEWLGLSLVEAERKQIHEERRKEFESKRPLKEAYLADLIQDLKVKGINETEETPSLISRINPFKKES